MNKNLQRFFYFFFLWNIVLALQPFASMGFFVYFEFILVYISGYFLIREVIVNSLPKRINVPRTYKIIVLILLFWIFINIFRDPPSNPKGFIRFLGEQYYVAAWLPVFFFYLGTKLSYWSQIWHYAIKFGKLFIRIFPLLILLLILDKVMWAYFFTLIALIPLLILNWDFLSRNERIFTVLCYLLGVLLTFLGGSRAYTLRLMFYIPAIYWLFMIRIKSNYFVRVISINILLVIIIFLSYFIYNIGISEKFSGNFKENLYKFEKGGFENSRELYVYPDFIADMKTTEDWIFGRGINGSYFSPIFVGQMKELNETNSLGIKKGQRPNLECGYLQTILKIGSLGLVLELILALSAVFLGLFRSNNYFVKACAFIIIEWLLSMYPGSLPSFDLSYMLFWLCIGACLSRETRLATSMIPFIKDEKTLSKLNRSWVLINRF